MKSLLLTIFLFGASTSWMLAQDADPLALTLPNGKTVHFQTAEQKAKFETAQQRKAQVAVAAPTSTPTVTRAKLGSALDAPSNSGTGIVNTGAPTFTANYYMAAPASWVGKSATLAVAYVVPRNDASRTDGLVQMTASTWNSSISYAGDQDPGGTITLLATSTAASRLMQQCGSTLQWTSFGRVKVTLIKGEMTVLSDDSGAKKYGFTVGK